jgi:hypothetical protein
LRVLRLVVRDEEQVPVLLLRYINGQICGNGIGVRRDFLENKLLGGIKGGLLSHKSVAEFTSKMRRRLTQRPTDPNLKRRQVLEAELGHLVDAIGKGLLSATLSKRLHEAEAELAACPCPTRLCT